MISQSTTCSLINIFVDPGRTLQSTNQIWGISSQFTSSLGLQPGRGASFPFDFRDNLWTGVRFKDKYMLGLNFRTGVFFQDQQNMSIQEHV